MKENTSAAFASADKVSVISFSMTAIAAIVSLFSLVVVLNYYMDPPFWDQWAFFITLASDPNRIWSFGYIFGIHNEHIIATSKLLFLADLVLFRATNLFLILSILFFNACIAIMLARFTFPERKDVRRWAAMATFILSVWSLAQWENLIWAFQTPFSLVMIGAILSLWFLARLADEKSNQGPVNFAGLLFLLFFTIYSLGNGVLIIVGMIFILIARRQPLRVWLATIGAWAIVATPFIWVVRQGVVRHTDVIGDQSLRTIGNLIEFFLKMPAGPLSTGSAMIVGGVVLIAVTITFVVAALIPFVRGERIDRYIAILLGLCVFLLATVAATAWGRVVLGTDAALAPRYATHMLVLLMATCGALARHLSLKYPSSGPRKLRPLAPILVALVAVTWSGIRPSVLAGIDLRHSTVQQSAYFLASGVEPDVVLRTLYPIPEHIRPALAFLREHRLSMFAEHFGLRMPKADLIRSAMTGQLGPCAHFNVDGIGRLDEHGWSAVGWVAQAGSRRAPEWVLAFNNDNQLLGFTRPLMDRPDVVRVVHTPASFRGFEVPIARQADADQQAKHVWLMAVFQRGAGTCKIQIPTALP